MLCSIFGVFFLFRGELINEQTSDVRKTVSSVYITVSFSSLMANEDLGVGVVYRAGYFL